jgi:hypothetical protein
MSAYVELGIKSREDALYFKRSAYYNPLPLF